jgi:hypothetical protein
MGMPSSRWDVLVRETSIAARRRKRRRLQRRMLWLLTVVTSAALAVIAVFVMDIAKVPVKARPAALSASARTVSHGTTGAHGKTRSSPTKAQPHPSKTPVTYPQVADVTSGLSYRQLSAPWQQGCPSGLNTPMLDWTAGENTVAGHVNLGGSVIDWHGLACSGPLAQPFGYNGPADLESVTAALVAAIDPAYYAGVRHSRTIEIDKPTRVSGHRAWEIEFTMTYPDGTSQGVTWSTELGAVVVADRGPDQAPAVFYVSVPATLGVTNVDVLINSLSFSLP